MAYLYMSRIRQRIYVKKDPSGEVQEKRKSQITLPLTLLVLFSSENFAAVVGTASLACSVGHNGFTALWAGNEAGSAHLPVRATSLVTSCLGYFTFRNSHDDTSLVKMPGGI